ncbi:tape measure domain-containing protein [Pullulanibacillus pueri]|nr:tape measure domain-containing protein [Pullulanibacillus pueri]
MNNLDRQVSGIAEKTKTLGKGVMAFGAGMGAAVGATLGIGTKYLADMEQAEVGLNVFTKSASKTKDVMADLQNFAVKTPFDFPSMLKGDQRLMAMGMSATKSTKYMKDLADAVAGTGGGVDELDGVVTAIGQIQAKGKISAEEMQQLAERGIPSWQLLSKSMKMPIKDLMQMAANGKLMADDALPALQKGIQSTFGGSAAAQADTFSGRLQNLKENFQIFAKNLAKPIFEPLKNALGSMSSAMQTVGTWFAKLPNGIQIAATAVMILVPILTILGGGLLVIAGMLPTMITGFGVLGSVMTATAAAFTTVILPIIAIVAAIGLIVTALVLAYKKVGWFRGMVNAAWAAIKQAWNTAVQFISTITKQIIGAVTSFLGDQLAKIKAFWAENGADIVSMVRSYFGIVASVIKAVMGVIKGVFQAVWPIISGVVKVAWGVIKTVVSAGLDIILGLIKTVMRLLKGDWKGAWNAIKGTVKNVWADIKKYLGGIDLVGIGKDIIRGLANGITSAVGSVVSAAKSVGSKIKGAFTSFFGIHSPSRLMSDTVGKYLPSGIAVGMEKSIGTVRKAADKVSAAATPQVGQVAMPVVDNQQVIRRSYAGVSDSNNKRSSAANGNTTPAMPSNMKATINIAGFEAEALLTFIADKTDRRFGAKSRTNSYFAGIKKK